MRYAFLLAAGFLLCGGVSASHAQPGQEACYADAQRLCSEMIPDRQRVVACLLRNKGHLSTTCRTVISRDFH